MKRDRIDFVFFKKIWEIFKCVKIVCLELMSEQTQMFVGSTALYFEEANVLKA